jgi:hypothetical protein
VNGWSASAASTVPIHACLPSTLSSAFPHANNSPFDPSTSECTASSVPVAPTLSVRVTITSPRSSSSFTNARSERCEPAATTMLSTRATARNRSEPPMLCATSRLHTRRPSVGRGPPLSSVASVSLDISVVVSSLAVLSATVTDDSSSMGATQTPASGPASLL